VAILNCRLTTAFNIESVQVMRFFVLKKYVRSNLALRSVGANKIRKTAECLRLNE